MGRQRVLGFAALGLVASGGFLSGCDRAAGARQTATAPALSEPLSTGKFLAPAGDSIGIGSFPTTAILSPNAKFVAISSLGTRAQVTLLDASSGKVLGMVPFVGPHPTVRGKKAGLYVGLAFSPDGQTLYASRGTDNLVSVLAIGNDGALTDTGKTIPAPVAAGLAVTGDNKTLFVAKNSAETSDPSRSQLTKIDIATGQATALSAPGYPFAVTRIGDKIFVSSEQQSSVSVYGVDGALLKTISVGAQPTMILSDRTGGRAFVANAGADTVSVIDTKSLAVVKTILLRPVDARAIPSATPMGLALAGDDNTLYVACADLNAVAVVDLAKGSTRGFLPTGWYPTAVALSPDNRKLFVTSAKGITARNPNKIAPKVAGSSKYIQDIIEGSLSVVDLPAATKSLAAHTQTVLRANRITPDLLKRARTALKNPGIEHVIYIIKENRTYDQVLGDLPQGNGDASLTLFPRDVTPNQHALAERFVLLDNFYCSAEVSGDGWSFSTQAMASENVARNVPYGYTGKVRPYDYEGTNNGKPIDRLGVPDVARAPGGYLWDKALAKKVRIRNYGVFTDDFNLPRETAEEGAEGVRNTPTKKALIGVTCEDFRQYDLNFADSEAWVAHGLTRAPRQTASYGAKKDPSRITTWRREYDSFVKSGKMPGLMLVRFGRDHTSGTAAGQYSPRAMVADNDYAVGQLVETVSAGPFWKKTAIVVLEDDAQNGFDHVDAHRSIAFVISPYVPKGSRDSRFFNTDSVLHTIECLLGLDPMNLYDATAPVLAVFGARPENDAPFRAILPSKAIVGEINQSTAYKSAESARILNPEKEESEADDALNEILWRAIRGANAPLPTQAKGRR